MRYPISQMYYTKSTYIIVQNILFERLLNAVRVAVIDQWCNTELDYYKYLYGIIAWIRLLSIILGSKRNA